MTVRHRGWEIVLVVAAVAVLMASWWSSPSVSRSPEDRHRMLTFIEELERFTRDVALSADDELVYQERMIEVNRRYRRTRDSLDGRTVESSEWQLIFSAVGLLNEDGASRGYALEYLQLARSELADGDGGTP